MDTNELTGALEAIVFSAAEPLGLGDIKRIFDRLWEPEALSPEVKTERVEALKLAYRELEKRAETASAETGGFVLVQVAEGLTYRSNPRYAAVLRAMREEKPMRLSQAALETLSIVAYRQPVTKPEMDHIRGVDCGGTLRLLLDRSLVRIVGKKDEPGRPMLYGTTKDFLSFFNLGNLTQLPTLREFHELSPESQEEVAELEAQKPSLVELSAQAKKLVQGDEDATQALDQAVAALNSTENTAQTALSEQGYSMQPPAEPESDPGAPPPA